MDIISTRAIPLHTIKYSDSAVIVKVFTRESGFIAMIARGISSKKSSKRRLLNSFSLLDMQISQRDGHDLAFLKDLTMEVTTARLQSSLIKGAISMFLAEVLLKTLEEHYVNKELFDFVWDSIVALDQHDQVANFHLWFMVRLSEFYGFAPHPPKQACDCYFDLLSGEFTSRHREKECFNENQSKILLLFLGMKFDEAMSLPLKKEERKSLLSGLVDYFGFQVSGLKEINSHLVLETVLND